jgi:gamma-glutamyltranspeptidase/glutathione hydrolase
VLPDPDLANSHRLLAEHGLSHLDDGPIGQAIANADDRPALYPGTTLITQPGSWRWAIVRSYQAQVAQPTQVTDRGLQIYRMAPPSRGGSTEGEIPEHPERLRPRIRAARDRLIPLPRGLAVGVRRP